MIRSKRTRGFTLVELMVTVGIFAMITTVILARNSKFDDETLLQSASYDVALSVRTAQNYGINVLGQEGNFDNAYGVYFQTVSPIYVLFRDENENFIADQEEILETYELGRGFTIQKVCSFPDADPACTESTIQNGVSILFKRPNPEAIVKVVEDGVASDAVGVVFEIASPRGGQRFIAVQQTGQIGLMKAQDVPGSELPPPDVSPTNGMCGDSDGDTLPSAPTSGLCIDGSTPTVSDVGTTWTWTCAGHNGGTNASCTAYETPPPPQSGQCGSASGGTYSIAPSGGALCTVGSGTAPTPSGASWVWECSGVSGGSPTACFANRQTAGQCGSAVNSSWPPPGPTTNLCVESNPSGVTLQGPKWKWTCTGYNGGSVSQCQANKI